LEAKIRNKSEEVIENVYKFHIFIITWLYRVYRINTIVESVDHGLLSYIKILDANS
jgi:hypothetical protein